MRGSLTVHTVVGNLSVEKQESVVFPLVNQSFWLSRDRRKISYFGNLFGLLSIYCPLYSQQQQILKGEIQNFRYFHVCRWIWNRISILTFHSSRRKKTTPQHWQLPLCHLTSEVWQQRVRPSPTYMHWLLGVSIGMTHSSVVKESYKTLLKVLMMALTW